MPSKLVKSLTAIMLLTCFGNQSFADRCYLSCSTLDDQIYVYHANHGATYDESSEAGNKYGGILGKCAAFAFVQNHSTCSSGAVNSLSAPLKTADFELQSQITSWEPYTTEGYTGHGATSDGSITGTAAGFVSSEIYLDARNCNLFTAGTVCATAKAKFQASGLYSGTAESSGASVCLSEGDVEVSFGTGGIGWSVSLSSNTATASYTTTENASSSFTGTLTGKLQKAVSTVSAAASLSNFAKEASAEAFAWNTGSGILVTSAGSYDVNGVTHYDHGLKGDPDCD